MSKTDVLAIIADLLTDVPGDNPEYDRACVEIASGVLGLDTDDARSAVYALLRSLKGMSCGGSEFDRPTFTEWRRDNSGTLADYEAQYGPES